MFWRGHNKITNRFTFWHAKPSDSSDVSRRVVFFFWVEFYPRYTFKEIPNNWLLHIKEIKLADIRDFHENSEHLKKI